MSIREFFKRVPPPTNAKNVINPTTTNKNEAPPQSSNQQQVQIPVQTDPNLRSFDEIPLKYRPIFQAYNCFNSVQSNVFDDIYFSRNHIIISAPTGSGKTGVLELAIIKLLESSTTEDFQIIYLAPIKALCTERFNDWSKKFTPMGISVQEVTGDSEISDFNEISTNQIILSTPEKWDSLTRSWKKNLDSVKLLLIDEIHLLNDENRGPVIEAVVSRMTILKQNLRVVAVSATIPNIEDLAEWIGDPVKFFKISEDFRPIKLRKIVEGYKCEPNKKSFCFDMSLNYKLESVIKKYSEGKPCLIFCSSRNGVGLALNALTGKTFLNFIKNREALQDLSQKLKDPKLKSSIIHGIAYHHAGLALTDRNLIEDSFRQSLIPILLSTSTLAMGVNLPAHLVIIKSTQCYKNGAVGEYDESTILQMIGRAGRPQFDKTGTAVIMTQESNVEKYKKMVTGTEPIESHLADHLIEHLNSEIVLQTISSLPIAVEWIKSTFLYVRATKNPKYYKINSKENVEKKLEEMCCIGIDSLLKYDLVTKSDESGEILSTGYGKLMAKYYLNFETMKKFLSIKGSESLIQIFDFVTTCHEFKEFSIRTSEKATLNELNRCATKETIRFPIKGKIKTVFDKVSCLMQSSLDNLPIKDIGLLQECQKMLKLAEKLTKCLSEFIRISENRLEGGIYRSTLNSTILIQCFQTKLWENSPFVSRQIKKIGTAYSGYLVQAGKNSFDSILETLPRELERILRKTPPFGNELIAAVSKLPKYELTLSIERGSGRIQVKQTNANFDNSAILDRLAVVIGDAGNNLLYFNDNVHKFLGENNMKFERWFKIVDPDAASISGHLIHLGLVGVDQTVKLQLSSDDPETQPIVEKVVQKIKKPVVPVVTSTNTLITDFYDLTNSDSEQEFDIPPAVITDLTVDSTDHPEELPTTVGENSLKRKFDFCEEVSPKRKSSSEDEEEYFTQSVLEQIMLCEKSEKTTKLDEPQIAVEKSTIFFDKSEITSTNFDLGFEDYLNEKIETTRVCGIIPRTPSLLEIAKEFRLNNYSEKIETVLKTICDPNKYNPSHNSKKFCELNIIKEEDENMSPPATPTFRENFKSNDVLVGEISRKRKINTPDSTEMIFQNLTKKINQRITDKRVEEANFFKKPICKKIVTVPGSIEMVADNLRREKSLGRSQHKSQSDQFFNSHKSDFFSF